MRRPFNCCCRRRMAVSTVVTILRFALIASTHSWHSWIVRTAPLWSTGSTLGHQLLVWLFITRRSKTNIISPGLDQGVRGLVGGGRYEAEVLVRLELPLMLETALSGENPRLPFIVYSDVPIAKGSITPVITGGFLPSVLQSNSCIL